jgi:hypothetical protein
MTWRVPASIVCLSLCRPWCQILSNHAGVLTLQSDSSTNLSGIFEVVKRHSASTQHLVLKISGCCQTISLYTWLKVRTSSFESLYLSTICTNNSTFRTETYPISDSCSPYIETKRIYRSNWNGKDNKTSSNLTGRHLQKSLNQKKWQDYLKCIIMSVERVHQNKWHI